MYISIAIIVITPVTRASPQEVTISPIRHKANNTNTGETDFAEESKEDRKNGKIIVGSRCRGGTRSSRMCMCLFKSGEWSQCPQNYFD